MAFTKKSPKEGNNIEFANNTGLNNFVAYRIAGISK
jgi:hypothetical protein